MASSSAIPQLAMKGELIKGRKGHRHKRAVTDKDSSPPTITEEQWAHALGLIADEVTRELALESAGITRYALEGILRTNAKMRAQWEDAKLAALRVRWDQDTLDMIMSNIAMGATVKAACEAAFRGDSIQAFYLLMLKDPLVKEQYDEARMIQAEKMAIDDMLEISDDDSNDETWDGKANSAAVNRSRLKADTRRWIASKLHYKRFGDKVQQDVNANVVVDHAARLDAARKRKEKARSTSHDK